MTQSKHHVHETEVERVRLLQNVQLWVSKAKSIHSLLELSTSCLSPPSLPHGLDYWGTIFTIRFEL